MNFLVTGGAGFIGSNIVEKLLNQGHSVKILDNFATGKKENISDFLSKIDIIEGDIRDYHIVIKSVEDIDVILHQAALPSVPRSVNNPITTNDVNVSGTVNLLNAAREKKVKRFIMASSSSVYGNNPELPKKESFYPNPLSPYAVSKLSGEYYLKVFSELYSMETIAIRYFNVFGPRQDPNSQYAAVIPKFINAIINDEQPIIYGDGYQSRDFTYIENVVEANILAATKKINGSSLIVNCATHSRITLNELVEFINKYLGKEIKPLYTKEREGDVKHSFADITKISKELGYVVKVSFEEGLAKTIEYYLRQNGNR